ncbi:MAG: murein biosynthesis integral membrane protein MurJ [Acidimicrobiia bacterium]|nr:murein biosynthesis integral membrane protein MurJ [Acidimicrobiia bacterium]
MGKAGLVAAGILLSRLSGLIRSRVFAHYFGLRSDAADAFNAAFRIPNLLQNLFGEGALSGSFIPVYAGLLSTGHREEADRVAGAVGALLAAILAALVAIGVLLAPVLLDLIAPGFEGDKRRLTITLVRVLFPGAGLLVLSAWCLGILNSHQKFLLSYAAPVLWNAAMVVTLVAFGARSDLPTLAEYLAWGSVAGSLLQFLVQLPAIARIARPRLAWDAASAHVRGVLVNFVPVFFSRGVVQISAYIDLLLASLLPTGAVTGLANAQLIYTLPISLFGMSVAAAELPTMSGAAAVNPHGDHVVRDRLGAALRQVAFFAVPSAAAFLALGDTVAAAVLQTGRFSAADARDVWGILAGSSIGVVASTLGRLYASSYYALRETRTPLAFAIVRVVAGVVLGYALAILAPRMLGVPPLWGAAGLTAASSLAGWLELLLLRHRLNARLGWTGLTTGYVTRLLVAATSGAAVAWAVRWSIPVGHPWVMAVLILGPFGIVYFGMTIWFGLPEATTFTKRLRQGRS